ncbi:uncharacterized protein si:ch73-95l15.5 [Pungitius pungitius]|uniref:uncharacterized protein si:ch73-95l15.5 n=1 Tax=Pungitius pungitius TaxID=134920 RepID=UPI002E106890
MKSGDVRPVSELSLLSPAGSTVSLGSSSVSLSQLSLSSPSKAVDPLSVLTHILGQPVPRGGGRGEFVCGKCVSVLERVFKFDSVIARVRVLSSERLQKLTQERDKVRRWVRQNYYQRHPGDVRSRGGSTSEDDDEDGGEAEKEGYREMLKENMALSEYECWSEKWDACPYFSRTGKRCRNGKGCEGCDALRVSDSDYESVCGLPRRLPLQPFLPLAMSRDRSQSMPLHWRRVMSLGSDLSSPAGSTLSLQTSSRTESVHSLDSLDGNDPFDPPGVRSNNFWLMELRGIEGAPVCSPSGSRIPVLDRKFSGAAGRTGSPSVNRALRFEGVWENGDVDGEDAELRDEFMPLHRVGSTGRVHHAVRHLRGQLDRAVAHTRSPEGRKSEINGSGDWIPSLQEAEEKEGGGALLRSLGRSLHSRERVIQECVGLIRRLSVEDGGGVELANKLTEYLKETQSNDKAALQTLTSEATEKERSMEREIESLRKAGRDRERDLDTLNAVLQCNRDVLDDLRVSLEEKERLLKEVEKEKEVWRQRDHALAAVLQEKEALIRELASSQEGVQGFTGDMEGNGATLCTEVTKLTSALQEYQDMVQDQQASHSQTVSSLRDELRETRRELRAKEKEKKEAERTVQNDREDREREERKLRDSLEKRDRLIEQILSDAENRDGLLVELQQNLQNHEEHVTAVQLAP